MEQHFQRWTSKRKSELILQLIKGERKLQDICRENDLKQSEVEAWLQTFLKSGEKGLKTQTKDELDAKDKEIKELRAKVGELVLELDTRKKLEALIQSQETAF